MERRVEYLSLVLLVVSVLGATAAAWNDGGAAIVVAGEQQQSSPPKGPLNDDFTTNWRGDSLEDKDNRILLPLFRDESQRIAWRNLAALEGVKRWLQRHSVASNSLTKELFLDGESKRNGGGGAGYMCHFKLCQLGASNSGKRRISPVSFD